MKLCKWKREKRIFKKRRRRRQRREIDNLRGKRERESDGDIKSTPKEKGMRKSAGKSDPVWADEMGDGWGGVRDKSQRGLGLWEPLLLWSVKSTGSQWSTWPLRCAYSSKSACEAWQDNVSNPLQHGDPRPQVHSPADRCLTELTSAFFKHLYKS